MKAMNVYGWTGRHYHKSVTSVHNQVRCAMAAPSLAAVKRACDALHLWPGRDFICETGNAAEVAFATAHPGLIVWRNLDDHTGPYRLMEQAVPPPT